MLVGAGSGWKLLATAQGAPIAILPARPMPMAPKVGSIHGHDHQMTRARHDLVGAAGTYVGLDRLKRVNRCDCDRELEKRVEHMVVGHRASMEQSDAMKSSGTSVLST